MGCSATWVNPRSGILFLPILWRSAPSDRDLIELLLLVGELEDGGRDPAPSGRAIVVAGGRELISSSDSFLERLVAVALEHELRRPPNVDLRYHAGKTARPRLPATTPADLPA